jgi:hypothetical protein
VLQGPLKTRLQIDGFPEVRGRYQGRDVVLRATSDTLMMRKLPTLWLEVSVLEPLPYAATLSYLVRPCNTEFFSPSHRLPERLHLPDGWPQEPAMLRTDRPSAIPPLNVIGDHLRLWNDRRVKELVISPRGVRIVILADEGDRSSYMLLRQAQFKNGPVPAAFVQRLLDAALLLAEDLKASAAEQKIIPITSRKTGQGVRRRDQDGDRRALQI